MSEKKNGFFIHRQGRQEGPYSLQQLQAMLMDQSLNVSDYIFCAENKDWVACMQFQPLIDVLNQNKPKLAPPEMSLQNESELEASKNDDRKEKSDQGFEQALKTDWYILKGDNKFGPFAYSEVIQMLQDKVVFEFDFIWCQGQDKWMRLADLEAFSPKTIKALKESLMPTIDEVFYRRKFKRSKFQGRILVHNNEQLWKGQGVEISAGGAGVVIENSMILPGQLLNLHFKPHQGLPAFNAVAEVVSKKYVEDINSKKSPVFYGLKFTKVHRETQKIIDEFSEQQPMAV